jgi:hypothetical protein
MKLALFSRCPKRFNPRFRANWGRIICKIRRKTNFVLRIAIQPFCSFLLAQKMNQKRAKNPMLPRAMPTHASLDFWASPPRWNILEVFTLRVHPKHVLIP